MFHVSCYRCSRGARLPIQEQAALLQLATTGMPCYDSLISGFVSEHTRNNSNSQLLAAFHLFRAPPRTEFRHVRLIFSEVGGRTRQQHKHALLFGGLILEVEVEFLSLLETHVNKNP